MKKIILFALLALVIANGYAQKKGGFRVGLDLGYVPSGGGGGAMFSLEPKYNINENMNVGLRFGAAAIVKDLNTTGSNQSGKVSANGSYVGTYDYYFHKSSSSFAPYVGGGFGYYSLANVEWKDGDTLPDKYSPTVSGVFGGLIRGGFEWVGFRMGVEYNFLPDSDLEDIYANKLGTAKNAYLGIHIGFFVGGGKWKK
jgi:outer membrane protein X